jgi:tRNA pseudouridine55 synthase
MTGSATGDARASGVEPRERASPPRVERRAVDGVLLLDKPIGITSNAALQCVKRAYRAKKAGHTGTLDPLATGLLPICFGEATKFSQWLTDADKAYRADVTMGVTTETGDAEGRVRDCQPVRLDRADVEAALARFRGDIQQTPHRYSALKRDGRALYDYARAGEDVEIAARPVRIDALELEAWTPPVATLRIRCSKGTYVRSLAEALGDALGCGAHVSALRRLASGGFAIADAVTLDEVERDDDSGRMALLLPITVLVAGLPRIDLSEDAAGRLRHGLAVAVDAPAAWPDQDPPTVAVFASAKSGESGCFIGVGRVTRTGGEASLAPLRLLDSGGRSN